MRSTLDAETKSRHQQSRGEDTVSIGQQFDDLSRYCISLETTPTVRYEHNAQKARYYSQYLLLLIRRYFMRLLGSDCILKESTSQVDYE